MDYNIEKNDETEMWEVRSPGRDGLEEYSRYEDARDRAIRLAALSGGGHISIKGTYKSWGITVPGTPI